MLCSDKLCTLPITLLLFHFRDRLRPRAETELLLSPSLLLSRFRQSPRSPVCFKQCYPSNQFSRGPHQRCLSYSFRDPSGYIALALTTTELTFRTRPLFTMTVDFLIVTLAGAVATLSVLALTQRAAAKKLPPGPRPLPLIGNALNLTTKELWLRVTEWSRQYGEQHLAVEFHSSAGLTPFRALLQVRSCTSAPLVSP